MLLATKKNIYLVGLAVLTFIGNKPTWKLETKDKPIR